MGLISRVSSRTYRKSLRMRSEICHFSGLAIYPGHGKTYIKADGKKVILINGKSEKKLKAKRNRRALKAQRGIGGQSWAEIQAKKTVKPEVRKAQRDLAIAAAKQKKKEAAAAKKKASAAAKKAAPKSSAAVPKNQKGASKGAAKNFKK